jgi:hypothetical protein
MTFIKMQTVDMSWYRILHSSTWRATFIEAAGNAAKRVSKYSWDRGDYENAARWKSWELFLREYTKRSQIKDDK